MNRKVYLAGPITGGSFDGVTNWRVKVREALDKQGLNGYSPMRHKDYLLNEKSIADSYSAHYLSTATAINVRDYNDCKTSGAILVNLLGATKVSIGTVMEIAWARAFSVPVVIAIEAENVHQHAMLTHNAILVTSLDEAVHAITTILNP